MLLKFIKSKKFLNIQKEFSIINFNSAFYSPLLIPHSQMYSCKKTEIFKVKKSYEHFLISTSENRKNEQEEIFPFIFLVPSFLAQNSTAVLLAWTHFKRQERSEEKRKENE